MDPREQVRRTLESALIRAQRERVQGPVHAPPARFPHRDHFLEAQGLLPGEREAFAAHLARAELNANLAPLRRLEASALEQTQTYERQTREGRAWLGLLAGGEAKSSLVAQLSRAYGLSDGAPVQRARRSAGNWYAALRAEASSLGPHPDSPKRAPDGDATLADTDDLVSELASRFGVEEAEEWPRALQDKALDAAHSPAGRHRRVAAVFEGSALFDSLSRCTRVDTFDSARAQVIAVRPGERIHMKLPSYLQGVSADYSAAHATGRALGCALIEPSLPAALRWPVVGSMSRAMGALMAQTLLETKQRLSRREHEMKRGRLAAFWVLDLRLAAASLVASPSPELRLELASRTLGAPARPLSTWLLRAPSARARLRGLLGGLALYVALREHFDEDWFRNPRSAGFLREVCRKGGAGSVESALVELGGSLDTATARVREMVDY
ncbi:MAG: hypothetical protein AB8H86_12965 [Polyangiales bacterium]